MNGEFTLAVHALVFLNHKKTTVSSEILAENICTNAARVRKVMTCLKRAGMVITKQGCQTGGYQFASDADTLTLRSVAEALNADFISSGWRSGSIDKECLVASGMGGIMDNIYSDMNSLCYEWLEKTTISDIDGRIFEKKMK